MSAIYIFSFYPILSLQKIQREERKYDILEAKSATVSRTISSRLALSSFAQIDSRNDLSRGVKQAAEFGWDTIHLPNNNSSQVLGKRSVS